MRLAIEGRRFDGEQPIGTRATLMFTARDATLIGEQVMQRYDFKQLKVSPRIGSADRFIALPDGTQLQCHDHPALDGLPHESQSEGVVAWLEHRVWVAILALIVLALTIAAGYFYGLPRAAERIADHMPQETEHRFGERLFHAADEHGGWLQPSEVDEDTQAQVRAAFAELHREQPFDRYYDLQFRAWPFGPNAFALPGGTIVITDDMIELAESMDEIMAVLAHEAGHVERHHTTRQILQDSALTVAVATVTGDAATLSAAVAGVPTLLARMKNSRAFESEADEFAFTLLKQKGISPEAFASIMQRMEGEHKGASERGWGFLASHPLTDDRIQRAHDAARDFVPPPAPAATDETMSAPADPSAEVKPSPSVQ